MFLHKLCNIVLAESAQMAHTFELYLFCTNCVTPHLYTFWYKLHRYSAPCGAEHDECTVPQL